jgi:hypothetical protein
MPKRILSDMQDINLFKEKISSSIFIFIGLNDDLIPLKWPLEFALSQDTTIKFFDDDHSFTQNMYKLPQIISKILYKNIKK